MRGEANVKRRAFLWTIGAATLVPQALDATQSSAGVTVLYDGRAIALDRTSPDPARPDSLWIQKTDLPRVNGFELKPQGACREDICIPIPRAMMRGPYFNLTAFAQRAGQRVLADPAAHVWSFGEIPVVRGSFLESRIAPDVVAAASGVIDHKGRGEIRSTTTRRTVPEHG
jgi:hypothetical protein